MKLYATVKTNKLVTPIPYIYSDHDAYNNCTIIPVVTAFNRLPREERKELLCADNIAELRTFVVDMTYAYDIPLSILEVERTVEYIRAVSCNAY